ncbi:hypothetical protein OZQ58_004136, partial [Escherichia coli]|nr:hypothetical protein [Escherichia coli]
MATTLLEVIDTAVKIGLGSLITLAGTIVVTKLNHTHDNSKENRKRYYDSLEIVGSNVEEITHVALRYWAIVVEWVRLNQQDMELTEKRSNELEKNKSDLFDQFKCLTFAESKLLLLNLEEQSKLIREYGEFLTMFRRKFYDGNRELTEEMMQSARLELLKKREILIKSLAKA